MPWTDEAQTKVDIMGALGLPLTAPRWVEWVQRAMDRLAEYSGQPGIDLIEDSVTKFQAAQTSLNTNSEGAALIKADVLEWSPGQRNSGYVSEMSRYRNQLLDLLFWEGEKAEIRRNSSAFSSARAKVMR